MDNRTRGAVTALSTGTLLSPLNSSMIAVALIPLRREFDLTAAEVTWVVTAFYLASAAGLPVMGRLADRFGPRRIFAIGMVLTAVVPAATVWAPSFPLVCVGRAGLALASATAFPSAMALIRPLSERSGVHTSHLLGRIQIANTSGAAVGPVLGGVLETAFGWQAIMAVNVPLALLAAFGVAVWTPDGGPRSERDRSPARFSRGLDHRLLTVFAAFALFNLVFYIAFFGMPQVLQERGHYSSGVTGLLMFPLAAVTIGLTPVVARAIDRYGLTRVLRVGGLLLAVGAAVLFLASASLHPVAVIVTTAGLGVPYCVVNLALTQALYASVSPNRAGAASGVFQATRYLGAILATSLLGVVFSSGDTAAHWAVATTTAVVLTVVHGALAWRWHPPS